VMDVDVKRQRISLTMRLDDAPGASSSRSGDTRVGSNPAAARGPGGALKERTPEREPKPGGAIAMALERAKLKKE
jgi:uncharacterized protein